MSFINQHDETIDHVDVCSVCNSIEAAVEYWGESLRVHAEHVNKGDSGYDANERTGNSERPASNVV
jgi:hypothetical protein